MTHNKAQATIELGRRPDEATRDDAKGSPPLGRRVFKVLAEVLRRNVTDPENEDEEIVEDQLSEIDRMDALLSDLSALARLDAGRLEVEDKLFDLAKVAAETAGRFLTRAADEGVQLEVGVPDEMPVHGDLNLTEQFLAALLDNAIRYIPKGGIITVSGQILDGWVEVSVKDTGPGVSRYRWPVHVTPGDAAGSPDRSSTAGWK
jgi:two-component system sensor histidine kinase ResE